MKPSERINRTYELKCTTVQVPLHCGTLHTSPVETYLGRLPLRYDSTDDCTRAFAAVLLQPSTQCFTRFTRSRNYESNSVGGRPEARAMAVLSNDDAGVLTRRHPDHTRCSRTPHTSPSLRMRWSEIRRTRMITPAMMTANKRPMAMYMIASVPQFTSTTNGGRTRVPLSS